jgi:DNA/RNA-binding domain of Phe-tRNA-synthetase-like protein
MDKKLLVAPEVYERIPGLIVLSGVIDVSQPNVAKIKEHLDKSWGSLREEVQATGYKTQPRIAEWRESLIKARIPVKAYPPSIEAIAKRAMTAPTPFSINPIVDAYNAVSMELILPLGAYDLDELEGDLQLRTAQKGEDFQALGGSSHEPTLESEIVYADNSDILTRQFLWRQSDKAKITKDTKHILFVCELLDVMGGDMQNKVEETIRARFTEFFGTEIQNFKVSK